MSDSGIEHLSQLINPNTSGILWFTDELLNYESPGAYEINYLLNGILTKSLAKKELEDQYSNNFFLGDNFGKPFFVAHTVIQEKADFQKVYEILELAKPFIQEKSEIYILNRSKNTANVNVLKELKSKRKNIDFKHLTI
ncbi:MAG: hypothetical protein WD025_06320 [Bacteriovoracaceae bacterium]